MKCVVGGEIVLPWNSSAWSIRVKTPSSDVLMRSLKPAWRMSYYIWHDGNDYYEAVSAAATEMGEIQSYPDNPRRHNEEVYAVTRQ